MHFVKIQQQTIILLKSKKTKINFGKIQNQKLFFVKSKIKNSFLLKSKKTTFC